MKKYTGIESKHLFVSIRILMERVKIKISLRKNKSCQTNNVNSLFHIETNYLSRSQFSERLDSDHNFTLQKSNKNPGEIDLGRLLLRRYIINLKIVTKDKLILGSRSNLVEPKGFADELDVGYKVKRSQGFPSLSLFKGSKTNYINNIKGKKKK